MINLKAKKRLVSRVTGYGVHRIVFDTESLEEIEDAITRQDVRGLLTANKITIKPIQGTSRGRAHHKHLQKKKRGATVGSKQGKKGARVGKKAAYVRKVRSLRYLLNVAKDRNDITNTEFWQIYKKVGGNTVRNKAHLRQILESTIQARGSN